MRKPSNEQESKTVGILGGMGPLATVDLFRKIVLRTDADCDNAHIHVIIDNNVNIPDRTQAILHGGENPVPEMLKSASLLEKAGADVILMPCNTAHFFLDRLLPQVHVPFLNMLSATALRLKRDGISAAGLLATEGTIQSGIYEKEFQKQGIRTILPDEPDRRRIMNAIYSVKGGKPVSGEALRQIAGRLRENGAGGIVLGCTELPIAFQGIALNLPCYDPTEILAEQAVLFAGKKISRKK